MLTATLGAAMLSGCAAVVVGGAATGAAVANDRRTTGSVIEDQAIELKARKAISDAKDVDSQTHINVTSYNQIVLLSGEANSEELRRQAVDLVSGVEKIRHVHNEIQIAAPSSFMARSNDTVLTTKVKTKLFATKNLDATRVKVVTEAGNVYLMGLLSQEEAQRAAEAASQVSGVLKVIKLFEYTDSN
ncbi:MAG: BON domain-containing protein [Gammaproteobacteria bacterium]|nr:BON domain-containing protein [Gammaproteobacteria bacterium]